MKTLFTTVTLLFVFFLAGAQEKTQIYNPKANAEAEIAQALEKAKAENKHVLLQVGGNWCGWCIMLHKLMHTDTQIDSAMNANYVFQTVNYSKENKNTELMVKYTFPNRFGFPVLVILDAEGNRIHTQNTVCLEEGKGYNKQKILEFLNAWTPAAIDPNNYKL